MTGRWWAVLAVVCGLAGRAAAFVAPQPCWMPRAQESVPRDGEVGVPLNAKIWLPHAHGGTYVLRSATSSVELTREVEVGAAWAGATLSPGPLAPHTRYDVLDEGELVLWFTTGDATDTQPPRVVMGRAAAAAAPPWNGDADDIAHPRYERIELEAMPDADTRVLVLVPRVGEPFAIPFDGLHGTRRLARHSCRPAVPPAGLCFRLRARDIAGNETLTDERCAEPLVDAVAAVAAPRGSHTAALLLLAGLLAAIAGGWWLWSRLRARV